MANPILRYARDKFIALAEAPDVTYMALASGPSWPISQPDAADAFPADVVQWSPADAYLTRRLIELAEDA